MSNRVQAWVGKRALRTAAIVVVCAASTSLLGCDRILGRLIDGTGFDGTPCVGWSIRHGSAERCCGHRNGIWFARLGLCEPPLRSPFEDEHAISEAEAAEEDR